MIILFFDYTIEDFPNLKKSSYVYFPFYIQTFLTNGRNWGRFRHLTWKLTHSVMWDNIFAFLGFEKGWDTRKETNYIFEAKKELKQIFTPTDSIVTKAHILFDKMHEQADIIIGMHIRRGDYVKWNGGVFYYELSDYYEIMCRIKKLYSNHKVAFFISTNEILNLTFFNGCLCFSHPIDESAILDLYSLSLCDRIVGPVSTFSRWASFIGEKPLCFLYSKDQMIKEDSFSTIIDFFHFADGHEIKDW